MMHRTWSSIKKVPYCFSRSYVKLQGHTAKKTRLIWLIWRFRTVTPVWIHWWIWNDTQSLMLYRRHALLVFGVNPSNLKVTRAKIRPFESNLNNITRPFAAIKSLRFALFHFRSHLNTCISVNNGTDVLKEKYITWISKFDKKDNIFSLLLIIFVYTYLHIS